MPQVTVLSRAKENDRGCLVATSTFFPLALATHKLAIGFKGLSAVGGSEEQQLHKNNHCDHRGHLHNSIKWLNPPTFQKSSNSSSLPLILTSKLLTLVSEAPPEFPASSLLKRRRLLLDCTDSWSTDQWLSYYQDELSIAFLPKGLPVMHTGRIWTWMCIIHPYVRCVYVCMCFLRHGHL